MAYKLDIEFLPRTKAVDQGREEGGYPQIHWTYALRKAEGGKAILTGIFSQGLAFHPLYAKHGKNATGDAEIRKSLETGKYRRDPFSGASMLVEIKPPTERDILSSLAMDASALNEGSFEGWADSLGYNADSIKAKVVFDECIKIAMGLRQVFTEAEIEALAQEEA